MIQNTNTVYANNKMSIIARGKKYEKQVDSIRVEVEDIPIIVDESNGTGLNFNADILRRLKNNDPSFDFLWISHWVEEDNTFNPTGEDLVWLGYFIGKNSHLKHVTIFTLLSENGGGDQYIEAFCDGFNCNHSIEDISFYECDLLGGALVRMLSPFFTQSSSLKEISFATGGDGMCVVGRKAANHLALAMRERVDKSSLETIDLDGVDLQDESLVEIAAALVTYPQLKTLSIGYNEVGRGGSAGCLALRNLLQKSKTLRSLNLSGTDIDDEALESLIPAIVSNPTMRTLDLSSIYYFLMRSLIPLLESSNLTELKMERRQNVDDEDARIFAIALAGNHTMKAFSFDSEQLVKGWDSFSRLLCNQL